MALTAEVTKAWPTYQDNGLFYVGVEVVLNDDDEVNRMVDALEQKRNVFRTATSKAADPKNVATAIIEQVQAWIDAYVTEKKAHEHAKYESMRSTVAAGLDLTE